VRVTGGVAVGGGGLKPVLGHVRLQARLSDLVELGDDLRGASRSVLAMSRNEHLEEWAETGCVDVCERGWSFTRHLRRCQEESVKVLSRIWR